MDCEQEVLEQQRYWSRQIIALSNEIHELKIKVEKNEEITKLLLEEIEKKNG